MLFFIRFFTGLDNQTSHSPKTKIGRADFKFNNGARGFFFKGESGPYNLVTWHFGVDNDQWTLWCVNRGKIYKNY